MIKHKLGYVFFIFPIGCVFRKYCWKKIILDKKIIDIYTFKYITKLQVNVCLGQVWAMTPFYSFYLLRQNRKLCARLVLSRCRFFKKLPKRELLRASLTPDSVRPSVHPSRGTSSVAWWDIRLSSFPQHHRAESRAEGERARDSARASSMCRRQGLAARAHMLRSRARFALAGRSSRGRVEGFDVVARSQNKP